MIVFTQVLKCALFYIRNYWKNIIMASPLSSICLSGTEQTERDTRCCQGYRHKDGGWIGGLHGRDWYSGLLQPPSHCQAAGCLLLRWQTVGEEPSAWRNAKIQPAVLVMCSEGDKEARNGSRMERLQCHKNLYFDIFFPSQKEYLTEALQCRKI